MRNSPLAAMLIAFGATVTVPAIAAEKVQEPPGNTSSTHNPQPSSTTPTTELNRKDGETGTVTSTHNPPKERCVNSDCPSAPGK